MKLNIGISCYPTVGGSGIVAAELGKQLAERGHTVHFISTSMPFRLNKTYPNIYYHEVEVNQYEVFQYPPYTLTLASKMSEVAKREKLDILHVHYAVPHAICALLAKDMAQTGLKVVTTLHGTDITVLANDASLKESIYYAIEKSDAVTAVSQSLAQQTKDMLGIKAPIDCIYNFIEQADAVQEHSREWWKKEYNIPAEHKVMIHISNFRPVKRVEDVIEAFYTVQLEQKATLLMIGDGPDLNKAWQLAEKLGIAESVLFLGNQKNISDFLNMSDVMFLLSEKESFGLAALEAMACGVPVVGTDVGGIPEVIEDGRSGLIVPAGDAEAAGKAALHIIAESSVFQSFSSEAKKRAKEEFSALKIVQQYEDVYKRVLADGESL
ncbi:N-acetyl-alpha-D-glucosaminyl L-malate synthase BshA [Sinobaca qinghaiensis]|uniref:N-acetyl-alpha-D-glucosaminyl L-malate synthase BshA n=1 Tax=Sinobaca qinghaiensis TaxID=342944 RepID=A0A419V2Z3_9BACL|nr:N-acetyl-alpha-D-glucosaminyl L-malate synthase BshA [Sinobaca qinghaiensis]RKD72830.1 N-acetyl-alpha-D-glucosaminyl L-malate synthase BshA [Sinobaca qinghaiensis]